MSDEIEVLLMVVSRLEIVAIDYMLTGSVRNLVSSVDGLDEAYVRDWASKLGVDALLKRATSE